MTNLDMKPKLMRITTVPESLSYLLKGQLRFMNQYCEVIGISSNGEELNRVKMNEDIKVIPVNMTRTISPLKDLKALFQLYKILLREKPLIVHAHTPKAGTVGMLAAKLAGVPYRLYTVAGLPLLETTGLKRMLLNLVEKITYSCTTMVYPNSAGLYEIIIKEKFCLPEKLKVISQGSSNGIDTNYFNPDSFSELEKRRLREELGIYPGDIVFIFVGRLVSHKGINELVNAFKVLFDSYPNVKLLLVGRFEDELDPLKAETKRAITHHTGIIKVGFKQDVRPYFAIADVLAFPSYREGFPNVVMQAGAMRLPSIVTDINGCNEIIIPNQNGIIIPAKDEKALLQAMQKLLNDRDLLFMLKNNSRRLIKERYEQTQVWKAILAEYQRITNNFMNADCFE